MFGAANILVSGIVRITCLNSRHERVTVALIAPGLIPHFPAMPTSHFDFQCEAYNDCRVGSLNWNTFDGIAENAGGGNHKFLSGAQNYRHATGERSGSNLGPLQVSENGEGLVQIQGRCAQDGDALGVIYVRAMRELQARDIHAGAQEPFDHSRRAAGGSDGANNFRVSKGHGLFSHREFRDDMEEHFNAFVEGCDGEALVVTVHAP